MITRNGQTYCLNTVRGIACEADGCRNRYSSVVVDYSPHATDSTRFYCRRCYTALRCLGEPTFTEILEDAGYKEQ